jgi:hypothetical protein
MGLRVKGNMRRILIAIVILALMSISPLLRLTAIPKTAAVAWDTGFEPTVREIDFSKIQAPDNFAVQPAGVASTYNVYTTTTSININYVLTDTWFDVPTVAYFAPQTTGTYNFLVTMYITNPSYKWVVACYQPTVTTSSQSIGTAGNGPFLGIPTNSYLKPAYSNLTESGNNIGVWEVQIVASITSTSGTINLIMTFNQMRTDLNNDGKVGLADLVILANHWTYKYPSDKPRNDAWNIIQDYAVDNYDLAALSHDYGRTIPP